MSADHKTADPDTNGAAAGSRYDLSPLRKWWSGAARRSDRVNGSAAFGRRCPAGRHHRPAVPLRLLVFLGRGKWGGGGMEFAL